MHAHLVRTSLTSGILAGCLALTAGCSNQQTQQDHETGLGQDPSENGFSMTAVRGSDDHQRQDHGHHRQEALRAEGLQWTGDSSADIQRPEDPHQERLS